MKKVPEKDARAKLEDVVPRSAPFSIFLDPCGACNFKCRFCPCNLSDFREKDRHQIMTWECFEKIVEDLRDFDKQVKIINLYGYGEPLLNPRIADMVRLLKQECCSERIWTSTNGSLLTENKSQELIDAGVDQVRVSVEALSTEDYWQLCGVKMEFSQIVQNVKQFYQLSRGSGSKIAAKIVSETLTTESKKTQFYDIFGPITDYCYIEDVEEYWADFNSGGSAQKDASIERVCYQEGAKRSVCSYPFTHMFIYANGIVGACCSDWKFATQYGDVNQEHLSDIWNGEKHIALQTAHLTGRLKETIPYCYKCVRMPPDHIENPEQLLENILKKR